MQKIAKQRLALAEQKNVAPPHRSLPTKELYLSGWPGFLVKKPTPIERAEVVAGENPVLASSEKMD